MFFLRHIHGVIHFVGGMSHGPRGPRSFFHMLSTSKRQMGLRVALTVKYAQVFMAKEYTLSIGKLPPGGLSNNSLVRITDQSNMTTAVYCGRKASNQKYKQKQLY